MNHGDDVIAPRPPQEDPAGAQVQPSQVFRLVEQMPEFPGGNSAMMDFLRKNLRYPELARDNDI